MGYKHKIARRAFRVTKKIINSNKFTKKVAQKGKQGLYSYVARSNQRELYNLSSYYPTIAEYYDEQHDSKDTDPLISILLPTYNTPEEYLRECIESIIVQSYSNWELCIADDHSSDESVIKIIEEYIHKDKRIKLVKRTQNGHISLATNSALDIAKGEFIALMDHDDVLWPNALYEMVKVIRNHPTVDLIYSDEDKIDGTGKIHSYPFLKPQYSPEFLESCNYITHFSCIRRTIMNDIHGFRKGYEGAQDWDLFIRIGEITSNIIHLPKILYSWRIHEASTASDTDAKPYVYEAQRKLLEDHISRQHKTGEVVTGIIRQHRTIKYDPAKGTSLTVVVTIADTATREATIALLRSTEAGATYSISKNPSIDNTSLDQAGSYLVITVPIVSISEGWARLALADSQIKGVGIVYPVLLKTDKSTIQSAGIGIGYGKDGLTNMLEGMPLQDDHYTRGLYAKSRRNISAGSPALYAVSKQVYNEYLSQHAHFIDANLTMLDRGLRHIYTPYIQVVVESLPIVTNAERYIGLEDQYLNLNFNKQNGRMEVKA